VAIDRHQVVAHSDTGKSVRLLIIEDEPLIASYIQDVLGGSGYCVVGIAASGPEALAVAAESHPTLALVDIRLTGPIDGIELACLLRHRLRIPAIFLSGLLDAEIMQRAQAAQPLGFLRKPVLPSRVFNAIEQALRQIEG
jgi:CheY-like chemotaxis protein